MLVAVTVTIDTVEGRTSRIAGNSSNLVIIKPVLPVTQARPVPSSAWTSLLSHRLGISNHNSAPNQVRQRCWGGGSSLEPWALRRNWNCCRCFAIPSQRCLCLPGGRHGRPCLTNHKNINTHTSPKFLKITFFFDGYENGPKSSDVADNCGNGDSTTRNPMF